MLYAETFGLVEHIAGGCQLDDAGTPTYHGGQSDCYYSMNSGDYKLYRDGMDCAAVTIDVDEDISIRYEPPYDGLKVNCYTVFQNGIGGMFSS